MSIKDYRLALGLGQAQYKQDLARGVYPYLQVLENITQSMDIISEIPLGVVDIPLDQVVGTYTQARSTSFASNFMPLMKEETEFAFKWNVLADSHIREGIRDPIKCYEFRNRFYVVEGNKRISVLKYFGAVEFRGNVTRLIARSDGSEAAAIYQEFLKFYRISSINYVNFTREGSYPKLIELLGRDTKEGWDQDFKQLFKFNYYRFAAQFKKTEGKELSIPVADAFLEYLKVYPFEEMASLTDRELSELIQKMKNSFQLLETEVPVVLHMQPEEDYHRSIMERMAESFSFSASRRLKVALVYGKNSDNSVWTFGHELGRQYLQEVMGDELEITAVEDALNQKETPDALLNRLAEEGHDVIFTTTPVLISETMRAAIQHPRTKFLNCSVNTAVGHIRTYYGRMYEAKFLAGLVAGSMTKNDRIAYVADYPISGMTANINAFSRGVQLVNPRAAVYLIWSSLNDSDVERSLLTLGADIVSHQDLLLPGSTNPRYGLYRYDEQGNIEELALTKWNWGLFYERILQSIRSGSWELGDEEEESHAINYWWGLSSGVIDIELGDSVPEGIRQQVDFYKKAIVLRFGAPFEGHLKDQSGTDRSEKEGFITTADIVTMDWLLDNVVGRIPALEEFRPAARTLLENSRGAGENRDGVMAVKNFNG